MGWKEALRPVAMLCSLLGCVLLSLLRALFEAVRLGLRHTLGASTAADERPACDFYEGVVEHTRTKPVVHSFRYPVRYCVLDLDHPRPPACCADQLADRLTADQARQESGCDGKVRMLLLPASAGFEENPIVVYFCYDAAGTLRCCLAEVTNTPWSDRVRFAFAPDHDALPKAMHVSPLQDMKSTWILHARDPGDSLYLSVSCDHREMGRFFDASLRAQRIQPPKSSEWWAFLMPHKVAIWIYWHAVVLIWRGVTFLSHPKSSDPEAYKREILEQARDSGRLVCPALGSGRKGNAPPCYTWRDATRYPWNG
eukprot:scaffold2263_cov33-Tisochrysis_lutea.AAC.2